MLPDARVAVTSISCRRYMRTESSGRPGPAAAVFASLVFAGGTAAAVTNAADRVASAAVAAFVTPAVRETVAGVSALAVFAATQSATAAMGSRNLFMSELLKVNELKRGMR